MEARAQKKHIRSSPRKMRLLIDLIRGKSVTEAFSILRFSTKIASKDAERLLTSAISNLSNNEDGRTVDNANINIKQAWVDCGPMMKRIQPAPMGRAYRVRKRSNHLTIVVETQD
ncbi:MAG: 50S ribosomal protein L22 [Candidatus Kapabacteria bacterium]|jgi:large subunit ribosomal protein L22|nr:50S ribosomal protein L22 [Candidatus Kapabacteria bacterium]